MDNIRFILVLSLAMVGMLLWQAWEQDYGQPQPAAPAQAPAAETALPPEPEAMPPPGDSAPVEAEPAARGFAYHDQRTVLKSDVLQLEIGARGAGIRRALLLAYPVSIDEPGMPLVLMDDSGPQLHISQGGLRSRGPAPTHEDVFTTTQQESVLQPGANAISAAFTWAGEGVTVVKTYTLHRGSYVVDVNYDIQNEAGAEWQGRSYAQLQRSDPKDPAMRFVYTYTGAVLSSPEERYQKLSFDDMREKKIDQEITNGWAAMLQHYFLTALIPSRTDAAYRYYTLALANDRFVIGAMSPLLAIPAAGRGAIDEKIYIGPKLQDSLEQIAEGLDLTVDYGSLWFIAKPLFILLEWFHSLTGNWGAAIILVTVLIKLLFYHLSAAGYKSMANMRRVQPRLKALQERHKNDRARLNQAMMQIYKEEKINPFGGCLPILIQIPVFISLYWVLLESVEMRQAPFVLWLRDLSTPDPYWVLPIIMGVTMFIQQKLNPAPLDPVQEKVMMIMPVAFTIFFGFFPQGLVLYWVVNNILSIGQQWLITRSIEKAGAGH